MPANHDVTMRAAPTSQEISRLAKYRRTRRQLVAKMYGQRKRNIIHISSTAYLALTLSYLIFTLPFTTWVLTTFMRELPRDLEEAAIIDGATPWITLTRVFVPLMGPAMAATGLLAFIVAWNEFLFARRHRSVHRRRARAAARVAACRSG
jgi:ABC-type glycerol-3-phosphate transport system permease component